MMSALKIIIICTLLFISFHMLLYAYYKRRIAAIKANAEMAEKNEGDE
jgi:uncharacterized membrane protein